LRLCALIDNISAEITQLVSEKNNKNQNDLNNFTKKISTISVFNAANLNFLKSEENQITNKNLKASFLSAGDPNSANTNFNNFNKKIKNFLDFGNFENSNKIENEESAALVVLESYQQKSVYKSLFKNCKNALNEIICIYKSRPIESNEDKAPQRALSPIVNNLTNNYNFNFNFNVPNLDTLSKSQEYKKNTASIKKAKASFFKNIKTNNNNNALNSEKKEKSNCKDENKNTENTANYNVNNFINDNNVTNKSNKTLDSSMLSVNFSIPNQKNSKNSGFTDYSVLDEKNEIANNLNITSFVIKPKNLYSNKKIKIIETHKEKISQNSILISNLKKRAESLNENFWEEFNLNSNNKMFLSKSSKSDFLNAFVNEEINDSIKLPVSKIRNVTLEKYNNKGSKIYFTKYVNFNSKKIFKLLCNKKGKQRIENESEADLTVVNLNSSCELDVSGSQNLFYSYFKKEENLNVNKNKNNYVNYNDKNDKRKAEPSLTLFKNLNTNKSAQDHELSANNTAYKNEILLNRDNCNNELEKRNFLSSKSDNNLALENLKIQYSSLIKKDEYRSNMGMI
jgi:hypothetical protein